MTVPLQKHACDTDKASNAAKEMCSPAWEVSFF